MESIENFFRLYDDSSVLFGFEISSSDLYETSLSNVCFSHVISMALNYIIAKDRIVIVKLGISPIASARLGLAQRSPIFLFDVDVATADGRYKFLSRQIFIDDSKNVSAVNPFGWKSAALSCRRPPCSFGESE